MAWGYLRGHDEQVERFRRAVAKGRLASTFLFVGLPGIGKRSFALRLAQSLLCERAAEASLAPCGECSSCHQVSSLNHPDVEIVAKPADKAFIPLELLIGDAEHRMRSGLCYNIALKPFSGRRKIEIIDDADSLNKEGANCLLKTLEEPPPKSLLILIGTSEQRQLPTIRSRCQIVRFQPLPPSEVAELLVQQQECENLAAAEIAAGRSGGSLERARQWCNDGLVEFRSELLRLLSQPQIEAQPAAKFISQFVDEAGKDSAAKRQRLRLAVSLGEELYRAALLTGLSVAVSPADRDAELSQAIATLARWTPADGPAACLDICLQAYNHIDANVNQPLFIDWWLDELQSAARSGCGTGGTINV